MRRPAKTDRPKRIKAPCLPALEQLDSPPSGFMPEEEVPCSHLKLQDCDWTDRAAHHLNFTQSYLHRLRSCRADFSQLELVDTILHECDFANAIWRGGNMHRVELRGCRFLGLNANESHWKDVRFLECNATLALFRFATFSAVRFEDCNLRGADFQEADLRGVVFHNCDLSEAELSFARLEGTDFRSSNIDGLRIGAEHVKGAIVEPFQAANLARLLGLDVRWTDD